MHVPLVDAQEMVRLLLGLFLSQNPDISDRQAPKMPDFAAAALHLLHPSIQVLRHVVEIKLLDFDTKDNDWNARLVHGRRAIVNMITNYDKLDKALTDKYDLQ